MGVETYHGGRLLVTVSISGMGQSSVSNKARGRSVRAKTRRQQERPPTLGGPRLGTASVCFRRRTAWQTGGAVARASTSPSLVSAVLACLPSLTLLVQHTTLPPVTGCACGGAARPGPRRGRAGEAPRHAPGC